MITNIKLIKEFVLCNSYYTKQLGHYLVPTFIFSENSGNKINIVSNRETELRRPDSSYVQNFKRDIYELSIKLRNIPTNYIEEFPVVIDDRELWSQILDYYNVPKDSEIRGRQYFLLDFLFSQLGFIVEIDSEYHIGKEIYDKARDHYLWSRFNLETLRFGMYGKDPERRKRYIKDLESTVKYYNELSMSMYSYNSSRYIDQSEIIIDNFIKTNKISLEFIDQLYKYTGSTRITRKISITIKDISKILPDTLETFCDPGMISMFLNNTSSILKYVYGVDLYIQDTTEYSLHNVLCILEISRKPNKWQEFMLQSNSRKIPRWIRDIMGGIPKDLKKIIKIDKKSLVDNGIFNFIQSLREI